MVRGNFHYGPQRRLYLVGGLLKFNSLRSYETSKERNLCYLLSHNFNSSDHLGSTYHALQTIPLFGSEDVVLIYYSCCRTRVCLELSQKIWKARGRGRLLKGVIMMRPLSELIKNYMANCIQTMNRYGSVM